MTKGMQRKPQPLSRLLKGIPVIAHHGNLEIEVAGLSADSRATRPGDLFFALPGQHADGHRFVADALAQGAPAALVQTPGDWDGNWVVVPDSLEAMAIATANFYEHPAEALQLIAVTGSNGKTTCAFLIEALLRTAGKTPGLLSTIEYRCPEWSEPATTTTPLSINLHRCFHRMREANVTHVVMEVSSHAIVLKRVTGLHFEVALFTNLTQDHLDFHKTMSAYGAAKKALFLEYLRPGGTAVLNGDDPYVRLLVGELRERNVLAFGRSAGSPVTAGEILLEAGGTCFQLRTPVGSIPIRSPLLGLHNVDNLLASAAVGVALQFSLDQIRDGLESVRAIPGRLEPVNCGQNFQVLVDYAHTPDALQRVLSLLRQLPHRRLLTVFGCGGERDPLKRPLMGGIVCELSDEVFVTTDNPRREDPRGILRDIEGGMKGHESKYHLILDRREAIVSAIQAAGELDIVLLAGKGHETTQTWADRTTPFDDRKIAETALRNR